MGKFLIKSQVSKLHQENNVYKEVMLIWFVSWVLCKHKPLWEEIFTHLGLVNDVTCNCVVDFKNWLCTLNSSYGTCKKKNEYTRKDLKELIPEFWFLNSQRKMLSRFKLIVCGLNSSAWPFLTLSYSNFCWCIVKTTFLFFSVHNLCY